MNCCSVCGGSTYKTNLLCKVCHKEWAGDLKYKNYPEWLKMACRDEKRFRRIEEREEAREPTDPIWAKRAYQSWFQDRAMI